MAEPLKLFPNDVLEIKDEIDSELTEYENSKPLSFIASLYKLGVLPTVFLTLIFVLPLLIGGADLVVQSAVKMVLTSLVCLYIFSAIRKGKRAFSFSLRSSIFPFVLYLGLQLLPIPVSILKYISNFVSQIYMQNNLGIGYLSVDVNRTLASLSWVVLSYLTYYALMMVPYHSWLMAEHSHKRRRSNTVSFSRVSREYDSFSELIQKVIILSSVVCSIIGVAHLALQMEMLFGLFSFPTNPGVVNRAHWPFGNANQLAVLLEVGLILSVTKFLRERQLKSLSVSISEDASLFKMIEDFYYSVEKQAKSLLSIFIISIGLILTMSRAGILLSVIAATLQFWVYGLYPAKLLTAGSLSKSRISQNYSLLDKITKLVKLSLGPVCFVAGIFFFIGSDTTGSLVYRVEETIDQSGSAPRKALNKVTLDMIKQSPIFGIGLDNWSEVANKFANGPVIGWKLDYAHNDILQLVSEVGILGFVLILIPLSSFILNIKDFFNEDIPPVQRVYLSGLLIALITPVIHSFVDFPFHLPALSLVIMSSLVCLLRSMFKLQMLIKSDDNFI